MSGEPVRREEIALTKELARRLQKKFPKFQVYANKCPSRGKKVRERWLKVFEEVCPPLQPEIDIIIFEPPNIHVLPRKPKIRAIEIKYFKKTDGNINQSFYKGIEQSLALLQWGFDNVGLWQLFDETLSDDDIRNYGCKTWAYIHGLLGLPIEFTPIKLIGQEINRMRFQVIQADWLHNLRPLPLLDLDSPEFHITYSHYNPLIEKQKFLEQFTFRPQIGNEVIILPGASKLVKEVTTLRRFLLDWLPKQKSGLNE